MIEITRLARASGPLTKRIHLSETGNVVSDGSACVMAQGAAKRVRLGGLAEFAALIASLATNEAIALGALAPGLPDDVQITTHERLTKLNGTAAPGLIARTASHIAYRPGVAALALIDIDTKAMPATVADKIKAAGGFWAALQTVIPELDQAARAVRTSTSSCLSRLDTGASVKGSNGVHIYLLVQDGADVERFLRTLHDRCWLTGLGWMMVGAGGQLLERSLIDRTVYAAERLVFEGPPILVPPLAQDDVRRAPSVQPGTAADTRAICADLSLIETANLRAYKTAERVRLSGAAGTAREDFVTVRAARLEAKGYTPASARRTIECQTNGTLLPAVILPFDAEELAGCTVADVLADPARFVGATLADPLEGIPYGRTKAKVMRQPDGSLWINSFAHGRTTYNLRHDAASVEAALAGVPSSDIADAFVKLLLIADLAPDEEQRLRDVVLQKSPLLKARPLDAKIKAARQEHRKQTAQAEREHRAATRTDKRLLLPVPNPDDERLPVMRLLDEALNTSSRPVPPLRDLDGHPVEVRCRPPMMLHELTAQGTNEGDTSKTRLPAPVLPLLTRHDRYTLAHEIEAHIEFQAPGDRPVALPSTFVEHFAAYRDSALPRVGAIVTAPLVMPDGSLLLTAGLDRRRKLIFQIEPKLIDLMPQPHHCTKQGAADAMHFLASEWLCDIASDFTGKCVLISLALTILERVLLPERPAFFVTAGKRGGGKTTAIMMVILAITGKKPAAAAWSSDENERRKAILAYLAEGLAVMVWDNIPLGSAISCPTMEKVLTAESYSDRILGQTATATVPAYTIMTLTGNNISPKGDLASRSLIARLEVARPDPENRAFTHSDPVAWTLENRGAILRALYTILLANPQLHPDTRQEPKTRFKTWWHLVGSAVEHAAGGLVDDTSHERQYAREVDFAKLFAGVEEDDEEGTDLANILDILKTVWRSDKFLATDIEHRISSPSHGEEETADTLRGFFQTNTRRSGLPVTSRSIGQRLRSMTGAPVTVGDRTFRLDREPQDDHAKQKRAIEYSVKEV